MVDRAHTPIVFPDAFRAMVPAPPTQEEIEEAKASEPAPSTDRKNFLDRFKLDGKFALVTGGARGLGYSMAEGLLSVGLSGLAIVDVQEDLGTESAKRLSQIYGVDVKFFKLDVRDENNVIEVVNAVEKHFGAIDVVVNSAGIADLVHAEDYSAEKFRRVLDVNVTGTFLVCQAAARRMMYRGKGGAIVNIASMSGHIVNYPQAQNAYNASKAAVLHLTKSLATEWALYGIRVNSISPGYMDTALNRSFKSLFMEWKHRTPMGRLGEINELTNACIYLASEASSFTTGTDILIDGGYTCV